MRHSLPPARLRTDRGPCRPRLYRDLDSLRQKLTRLRAEPALADAIAAAGQRLVEERYTFATVGRNIAEALRAPLRERRPAPALWRRLLPFMR